ncbi:MAG TPA: cache domain-containing protein [Pseudonocardia sp.]|nr:cache domain-containing protein [Pseudonocardia sp.]
MNDSRSRPGDEVVAQVSGIVEGIFAGLKPLLAAVETLLADSGETTAAELDRLHPQVVELLEGLVIGAGFIAAPRLLADQQFGFQWWTNAPSGTPTQLFISLDPGSEYFLDYTRQSWFTVPRDTGRRHITGPYVDYLCTDEYTLTFTLPVLGGPGTDPAAGGQGFAGVVGADIFVREFEHATLGRLHALAVDRSARAALVNAQGRVIVSTSARQATGSLVRELDIPAWWTTGEESLARPDTTLRRCGDAPIALLVTTR